MIINDPLNKFTLTFKSPFIQEKYNLDNQHQEKRKKFSGLLLCLIANSFVIIFSHALVENSKNEKYFSYAGLIISLLGLKIWKK